MTDITIRPIKTESVDVAVTESNQALQAIQAIDIKDQASYENVADIRKTVNAKVKELDKERKEITVPLDAAKKKVLELFKKPQDICKKILQTCDVMMIAYTDIQERKRKEEQDRLDRIAEKKRQELEAKAESKRAEGQEDKADRYEEKATEVLTPVAAPRVDKPAGVHYTERWYGEVKDLKALPDEYKIADESKINKVIQATKGTLPIPGVRVFSKKIVNSRG